MECWVKFNSLSVDQEIIAKSVAHNGIEMVVYAGNLAAFFMNTTSNVSYITYPTTNLSVGVWYHLAVSWNGTKESIRLYVNGVPVGTLASHVGNVNNGLANPLTSLRIGNWGDATTRFLNGQVDEVRIWSVNRTADQIKTAMFGTTPNQTGLTAYYKMDQTSGTTVTNSTATAGVNGTFVGSPTWVASQVAKNANALSFNSTANTYVNLGSSTSLKPASALTAELWVRSANWNVGAAEQELISCFESSGYGMYLLNGNLIFQLAPTSGGGYRGVSYPVSNLTNNTWYHLAGTFDGRYIRFYVNGALVGSDDLGTTTTISYIANDFIVGADAGPVGGPIDGRYFNGQIDEVRIWNVTRTQAQIQAVKDRELNTADATQTNGLVSYYTFNQGTASGTNTGLASLIDQKGTNNGRLINFAFSGTAANYVAQRSELVILPVSYHSFTAQSLGKQVRLQWSTAQEQNSSHFVLQHSTDNNTWNSIGTVQAAGNSNEVRFYDYTHATPAGGVNLYRIQQVDKDGRSSYTQVVKVNLASAANGVKLLYNYINDNRIQVQLDKPATVALYTHDGKLILQKQLGAGLHSIDVNGYAKGIYLLKAGDFSEKIMLQ